MRNRSTITLFAGLLAALLAAAPVRADLLFRGSNRSHEATVRRVYEQLPARGKDIDVEVWGLTAADWSLVDSFYGGRPGVIGLYFPGQKRLFLQADYSGLAWVAAHELGHHVWTEAFSEAERQQWTAF